VNISATTPHVCVLPLEERERNETKLTRQQTRTPWNQQWRPHPLLPRAHHLVLQLLIKYLANGVRSKRVLFYSITTISHNKTTKTQMYPVSKALPRQEKSGEFDMRAAFLACIHSTQYNDAPYFAAMQYAPDLQQNINRHKSQHKP
jgi:hypothetical protein